MNQTTIHREARRLLNAWPGFRAVQTALGDLPDLTVYLGGGALRRVLLSGDRPLPDLTVKDFDLFVDGPRLDRFFERLARAGRMESNPYGSPRWFPDPEGSPYADLIPVRRFTNGLWKCGNIVDVLRQVDCTINAAALDLRSGALWDPQNGRRDAARRIMRVSRFDFPAQPICPRAGVTHAAGAWHRVLHYASALGLEIEPRTVRWLLDRHPTASESRRFAETFFVPRLTWPGESLPADDR